MSMISAHRVLRSAADCSQSFATTNTNKLSYPLVSSVPITSITSTNSKPKQVKRRKRAPGICDFRIRH
jgi:hypothetical protein